MADSNFEKPRKIEFDVPDQEPFHPTRDEDTPLDTEFKESENLESTSSIIVDEYQRTIEFMKFVEELLRETSIVEVELDRDEDPEVWMAMNRLFENPSPKLNQDAYFQVIDQLEAIERIEQIEDRPEESNILDNLPNIHEVDESEINEEDFQISAIDEIEGKARIRRGSVFKDPPPSPAPRRPPDHLAWRRRWAKLQRTIDVLGKSYKVQSLTRHWWNDS